MKKLNMNKFKKCEDKDSLDRIMRSCLSDIEKEELNTYFRDMLKSTYNHVYYKDTCEAVHIVHFIYRIEDPSSFYPVLESGSVHAAKLPDSGQLDPISCEKHTPQKKHSAFRAGAVPCYKGSGNKSIYISDIHNSPAIICIPQERTPFAVLLLYHPFL